LTSTSTFDQRVASLVAAVIDAFAAAGLIPG